MIIKYYAQQLIYDSVLRKQRLFKVTKEIPQSEDSNHYTT